MNKNQKQIVSHVTISFEPGATITEEAIANFVNVFSNMYPVTGIEKAEVLKVLHSRLAIRMDRGSFVKEKDHIAWYYSAKKDLKTNFWERYVSYLKTDIGFSNEVVNALDASTDAMMDLLGNPAPDINFQRRGLVIGDVQSGKTATYTALINKAADAGYRIIIVLTGTIEKLRKQTQSRLDEGFIGLNSAAFINDRNNVLVGVGNIDPSISGWAVTSTTSDFKKSIAENLSGRLATIDSPVLFVLKKNKSVLEKLEQWLKHYNANQVSQTCPLPMLLIDDEADSASVNTRTDEDPTTININIRKLLKLFSMANYVGFTATPFANIFIDPESNEEMLGDDLFPRDFIYALEAPTNYVGARSVFSENGKHSYMLKPNDDCEEYLPEKHKIGTLLQEIPPSLKEAVASFFIANTVRDLRGHTTKHRSMLINISRFISTQDQITKVLDGYVRELQREIKNYYLTGHEALEYETFSFIKSVFDKNFRNIPEFEFSWENIQTSLHMGVAPIVVRTVNGGNASKNLNYDENDEDGLRIIAVGGFSLSRGLTLEGLCVSYFYRNSKMYDTVMQMGRWFGYRDDYSDICQIWMSEEAVGWYKYISEAADVLRHEVRRMHDQNKTPKEFGLRVRSDKNLLLVTARNKMKTAKDFTRTISLNGEVVETPYISFDKGKIQANLNYINSWAKSLNEDGYIFKKYSNLALENFQILNVPKQYITNLLSSFSSHYLNERFRTDDLVELINNDHEGTLDKWDILIANGGGKSVSLCGQNIQCARRNFGIKKEQRALQMSGKSSHLGETRFAAGGLTKEQVQDIEHQDKELREEASIKSYLTEELYFRSKLKRNPLFVIYPIELRPSQKGTNIEAKQKLANDLHPPIVGLSIGIPEIDGRKEITYKYKINKVMIKELFDVEGIDDEDLGEESGIPYQEGSVNNG